MNKRKPSDSLIRLRRGSVRYAESPIRNELERQYQRERKGHEAECDSDFHMERLGFLHSKKAIYIPGIRLPTKIGNTYFQIDSLLLTTSFALIIESKSSSGQFNYSEYGKNFIHDKFDMLDPIIQSEEQRDQLQQWLNRADYPIETIVGLSNSHAKIITDQTSKWIHERVMHFGHLKSAIPHLANKHQQEILKRDQLLRLKKYLLTHHTERHYTFNTFFTPYAQGVLCPKCYTLGMKRTRYTWCCLRCKHVSRDAHLEDLLDYFCFVHNRITNRECKHFLGLDSSHTAYNLLRQAPFLEPRGTSKGRYYVLKK
ncbi:nuclease-related domain-containing protein [Gracilibacillus marinus]|uniref:Nuclease-related domain-containing protein n=1 Tax=Gracilibacillus marinus TaxID=630535 RepID=A0ABV8VRF5_9BACI